MDADQTAFVEGNPRLIGVASRTKLEIAKQLRGQMTDSEKILWAALRANRCAGLPFRRQQVILGFIVDFYCKPLRLAIEVDGDIHIEQKEYDLERGNILTLHGVTTLRFTNAEVEHSLNEVLSQIIAFATSANVKPQIASV